MINFYRTLIDLRNEEKVLQRQIFFLRFLAICMKFISWINVLADLRKLILCKMG